MPAAAIQGLPRLRQLTLDSNPIWLEPEGAAALLSLLKLWRLSARIKPPHSPLAAGSSSGSVLAGAGLEAVGAEGSQEAGAKEAGAGWTEKQQQQQQALWRQLAAQLAAQHGGRVVLNADAL